MNGRLPADVHFVTASANTGQDRGRSMGTSSTSSVQTVTRPLATAPPSQFESLRTLLQAMVQGSLLPVDAIGEEAGPRSSGWQRTTAFLRHWPPIWRHPQMSVSSYAEFLSEYPRRVRAKNKFLAQELERIQQGLAARRVRSLGFKGPALTAFAYGSLRRRTCTDIDLLIPPDALPVAREWLGAEGYRYYFPSERPGGRAGAAIF